jgi:hypothetical protein
MLPLLLGVSLLVGCIRDPQRTLGASTLDQLTQVQANLRGPSANVDDACDRAGDARIALFNDAGPADAPHAWVALRQATASLMAACGQLQLLRLPADRFSVRGQLARDEWQQGVDQQLVEMCTYLRQAAQDLSRPQPDCH